MRALIKQRRILLKEWFRDQDPRHEEAVTQVGERAREGERGESLIQR